MSPRKRILLTLPLIICLVAIFILSHQPKAPFIEITFEYEDKLLHFLAYFILGISLIMASVANLQKASNKKLAIAVLLIGMIYGLSDEFHQSFVPGRDSSIFDWFADCLGLILSLSFLNLIRKLIIHRPK